MAKKSFKQKRKIVQRKKSVLPKIIIGAAVLGGGYLLYKNVIAPMLKPAEEPAAPEPTAAGTSAAINTVVSAASSTMANIPSTSAANVLSAIGTAFSNLKFDIPITYGSKGEEVKQMQKAINNIRKKQGLTAIKVDGDFGPSTWAAHKNISFAAKSLNWWIDEQSKNVAASSGINNVTSIGSVLPTASGYVTGGLQSIANLLNP